MEDDREMHMGVKVTDSEKGPHIEFDEKERRRLEQKWQNSLIIKLLGGSVSCNSGEQCRKCILAMGT